MGSFGIRRLFLILDTINNAPTNTIIKTLATAIPATSWALSDLCFAGAVGAGSEALAVSEFTPCLLPWRLPLVANPTGLLNKPNPAAFRART